MLINSIKSHPKIVKLISEKVFLLFSKILIIKLYKIIYQNTVNIIRKTNITLNNFIKNKF